MKTLISFVSGALTGALLLWFGFRQEVMVVGNGRLVRVDRFTGQASYVHVSVREEMELQRAENETLEREEKARKAAEEGKPKKPPAADAKTAANAQTATPDWRELTAEEIPRLEFKWRANGGGSSSVVLSFHNPFEKKVRINRVHVQIPARDGRAAIDRTYELEHFDCGPLADRLTVLDTQDIDWHGIELAKPRTGAVSGADPFGVPPPAAGVNAKPGEAARVTPVQVMMFP